MKSEWKSYNQAVVSDCDISSNGNLSRHSTDAITTNKLSTNNRNDTQMIMTTFFLSASAPVLDVFLMEFPMGLSSFPSPSVPQRKSICKRGHTCTQTKVGLPPRFH